MLLGLSKDFFFELVMFLDDISIRYLRVTCSYLRTIFKESIIYKYNILVKVREGKLELPSNSVDTDWYTLWVDIQRKEYAEKLFLQGRNIFVSGPGGTGKTHFVNQLCKKSPIYVIQTSTTGSSACLLESGQTIHSVLGFGLPKNAMYNIKTGKVLSPNEAAKRKVEYLISVHSARNQCLLSRLRDIKILRIDEISMLSKAAFEFFDHCLRLIRAKSKPFGGIQLIVSGDFRQFTPIPDYVGQKGDIKIEDSDKVILLSNVWKELNLHTVDLHFSYRQFDDPVYSGILSRMRLGKLGPSDILKLKERVVKNGDKDMKLGKDVTLKNEFVVVFPRNEDVKCENIKKLSELQGQLIKIPPKFQILDVSLFSQLGASEESLNPCTEIILKPGCKVMLTKNLNVMEGLTNGKIGTFLRLHSTCSREVGVNEINHKISRDSKLIIQFNDVVGETEVPVVYNTIRSIDGKYEVYKYGQFPITLAYAFTAHKVQGMTVDKLYAYCGEKSFGAHMLYVVFSRVRRLEDLYLLEFSPSKVIIDKSVDDYFSKDHTVNEIEVDHLEFKKRAFIFSERKIKELKEEDEDEEPEQVPVKKVKFESQPPGLEHPFLNNIRTGSHNLSKTLNLNNVEPGTPSSMAHIIYEKIINLKYKFEKEVIEPSQYAKNGIENEPYIIDIHKKFICNEHSEPGSYRDSILKNLSIARPDSIFFENGFYIPLEVKSPNGENYDEIPRDHILQLMFEIMCTDEKNKSETPYGDYISVVMDVETKKIVKDSNIIAIRVYRDENTIKMIRNRLMYFYNNFIFHDIPVPPNLFAGWSISLPKMINLSELYKNFDVNELIKN